MSRSAARTHCTARSNCAQLAHDAWRTGDEAFTIGRWHRQVERAIERSGLAWTFLRPNFFVQNYVTYFADDVGAHQAIHEPAGDVGVGYVDARDIAQAAARVLTEPGHDGRAYDLAGPEALTHAETAGTLTRTLGTGIRHVHMSDEEYAERLRGLGFPDEDAAAFADAYRYARSDAAGALTSHVADLTGRPPIPFAAFCATTPLPCAAERSAPASAERRSVDASRGRSRRTPLRSRRDPGRHPRGAGRRGQGPRPARAGGPRAGGPVPHAPAEATLELAARTAWRPGLRVLDVGCGLGGAARHLAAEHGCVVTGLDLTREWVDAADALTKLVGLDHLVTVRYGNAVDLPFDDAAFDVVWSDHAQMNIADKPRFYAEVARALTPGGRLPCHDILKGPGGPPATPPSGAKMSRPASSPHPRRCGASSTTSALRSATGTTAPRPPSTARSRPWRRFDDPGCRRSGRTC